MILKTRYKHLKFEKMGESGKTSTWQMTNHDEIPLGEIRWHPPWSQYCLFPLSDTLFAKSCLLDIGDFIQDLRATELAARERECGTCEHYWYDSDDYTGMDTHNCHIDRLDTSKIKKGCPVWAPKK